MTMRDALLGPQRTAAAVRTADVDQLPARLAFRELLLGVSAPGLPG